MVVRTLLLACFTLLAATARADEKQGGPEYYPVQVGNEWTYDLKIHFAEFDVTNDTSSVERIVKLSKDKPAKITLEMQAAGDPQTETLTVEKDGIYRHQVNDTEISPPVRIIAFPLKAGAKWEAKAGGIIPVTTRYTCTKEKVKVPAGEFDCYVISGVNQLIQVKTWLAPNVGKVKYVRAGHDKTTMTYELESYQLAGAKK